MDAAAWRHFVLVGTVAVALAAAPAAHAHARDGVFALVNVVRGDFDDTTDVAMLPDGSVVIAGAQVRRLTIARELSAIRGFGASGLAVAADGSVLGIDGRHNVIRRWTPGVGVAVVAGAGRGFGGDGGPATAARLRLEPDSGVAALPDGGFIFADTGNHRIRAADPAGRIRTLAVGFRSPGGVAATPDGGFMVSEVDSDRLRRIHPDGTVDTVARLPYDAGDIAVSADGTTVIAAGSFLWRLAAGSGGPQPYLRPSRATEPGDFAGRITYGDGVAFDPAGGVLVTNAFSGLVTYVPNGPTPWTLTALRDTHTSRRAVTAVIETTQPGTATLEILRRDRVVARTIQAVAAGHSTLRAAGRIRPAWHRVRLRLRGPDGTRVQDAVPVHGAQRLTTRLARHLLGRYQEVDEGYVTYLGPRCRSFGPRRVDCAVRAAEYDRDRCEYVASVTLGRTGVVLRRQYGCGRRNRARFRRHPRFDRVYGVMPLSPGYGGALY